MRELSNYISKEIDSYLKNEKERFLEKDTLIIDLHVHDQNDGGDGLISGLPSSFIETKKLIGILKKRGCNVFTITNYNSAASCRRLDATDVLAGAEFICTVPEYGVDIHVLAYGFSELQETEMFLLRSDIYAFLKYAKTNDIPVIWAHPFDIGKTNVPEDFFKKMFLVFDNIEIINGTRDARHTVLLKNLASMKKTEINALLKKFKLNNIEDYTRNPYKKNFSGGSDSRNGLFAGETGTRLYVPDLADKLKSSSRAELAIWALRNGNISPFGRPASYEKSFIELLYSAGSTAINTSNIHLAEILAGDFSTFKKAAAFAATKSLLSAKKKGGVYAFKIFCKILDGKFPWYLKVIPLPGKYKTLKEELIKIAAKSAERNNGFERDIETSFQKIFSLLMKITSLDLFQYGQVTPSLKKWNIKASFSETPKQPARTKPAELKDIKNSLSLPLGAALFIAWASVKTDATLNRSSKLADSLLSKNTKRKGRMLWLTDTFEDNNGIALVLHSMLDEIRKRNLPIDIMACSYTLKPESHLVIVPPVAGFTLPFYPQQPFRIPDIFEVRRIFYEGGYDRIICSTEGPMGIAALYLKNAFAVPVSFFVHTDWITFGKDVLKVEKSRLAIAESVIAGFYDLFDSIFVLNSEQKTWLVEHLNFSKSRVFQTAHWAEDVFFPVKSNKEKIFGANDPVILFTGRISEEKGVFELPHIYKTIKKAVPSVKIAIAGMGPAEKLLKEQLPEAIFLGWVNHDVLPKIYSSADILILPSRFDTFGCVVLEAMSCGLPVAAYDTKGPRDIIEHGESGYLATTQKQMIADIKEYLLANELKNKLKRSAIKRAKKFNAKTIVDDLMKNVGL
ncbi:MAG: glycosyltransferase [Leptospirales bacterium]|nr:glycosyltransferase [Leptospirales bacterium]